MKDRTKKRVLRAALYLAILVGVIVAAMAVNAATTTEDALYKTFDNVATFRGDTPTAPVEAGYVFAGWYKADVTAPEGYVPMSKEEADQATTAVAKFVDENVLGAKFQVTGGTTILSEKTDWRLLTSVDSKNYESVGFEVTIGKKTNVLTINRVHPTIYGYEKADAYNYGISYTPQETFSAESEYFAAYRLKNVASYMFASDMKVTPIWNTVDGTKVTGITRVFNIENALATVGNNLQAYNGTDFEGFSSVDVGEWNLLNCYNAPSDPDIVKVINDGTNSYAKLQPVENDLYATITKASGSGILQAGEYTVSMDVKLGSKADGILRFGIWDGIQWTPGWPMAEVDISSAKPGEWTTVTYSYTMPAGRTSDWANVDFEYGAVKAGDDNYILIDNIKYTCNGSNVATLDNGDFEGLVNSSVTEDSLATADTWVADNAYRNVIYVDGGQVENTLEVEDSGNTCVKFYTSTGAATNITFAGNSGFAAAGTYKMSLRAKLGPDATNVDNIGFRFYSAGELGAGDNTFGGLKRLTSDEWVTLHTYFTVPNTASTSWINMQFWAFTHNDVIQSENNYVLIDDIEVRAVTPNEHHYSYTYTTKPEIGVEGEVTATCTDAGCNESYTSKIMATPHLTRDGYVLSWKAVDKADGYKLYDNGKLITDLGASLSYTVSPNASHRYAVEAYTDEAGYRNVSEKSNEIVIAVAENLQASKGTDFEGFATTEVGSAFNGEGLGYLHTAAETSRVAFVNDGTNTYAKLMPNSQANVATLTKACGGNILQAGTYTLKMDVNMGRTAGGILSFGIYDGLWIADNINIRTADAYNKYGTWVTVEKEFTIAADSTTGFTNLDIKYTGVNGDADDYVLVDNIQILNASGQNVDAGGYGDFEGLATTFNGTLNVGNWTADSMGRDVVFTTQTENKIVVEDSGNKAFRFYTSAGLDATATFAGNPEFATAGTYKVSAKVKLGEGATNVDNIGFRLSAAADLEVGEVTFGGLEKLSADKWVRLETTFTVPATVSTAYVNMDFWVLTHNNTIMSEENYVLMDDIEVRLEPSGNALTVYSDHINEVYDMGVITGTKAPVNTYTNFGVGGTDLGIPYYDDSRQQMYMLFGDTFNAVNQIKPAVDWRSQTVGISKDFDLSDGLSFNSFISDGDGFAKQIIDSLHDPDLGEHTCIPTGAIVIDGTHYVYYMSIRKWDQTDGDKWDVNYCGVAKSTDGVNFTELTNLYWAEDNSVGQNYTANFLGQSANDVQNHVADDFLQIFPYRVGDYVYIFGISNGRQSGMKLGRVAVANIENFDSYEYYCGVDSTSGAAIWKTGTTGLQAIKNNESAFLVESGVGEFSICYNQYLGKYVMSYYGDYQIVMRTSDDLINWSDKWVITTSADYYLMYGGFSHERYMEENGKVMYFFISQYQDDALGEEGYNVRMLKVVFK